MIENKVIAILNCIDDNLDEMRVIEGFCFNTKVLNFKCINNLLDEEIAAEIILDKKGAKELRDSLSEWINEYEKN